MLKKKRKKRLKFYHNNSIIRYFWLTTENGQQETQLKMIYLKKRQQTTADDHINAFKFLYRTFLRLNTVFSVKKVYLLGFSNLRHKKDKCISPSYVTGGKYVALSSFFGVSSKSIQRLMELYFNLSTQKPVDKAFRLWSANSTPIQSTSSYLKKEKRKHYM